MLSKPRVVILGPTVKATELSEQCEQVAKTRGRTWTSNCHMGCIEGSVNYLWSSVSRYCCWHPSVLCARPTWCNP